MQGGSVCHITHTNTTQNPAEHNQTSWIPKPNKHWTLRISFLFSKTSQDFAVVPHPVMQQDVQGCLTFQARAECWIFLLPTGMRMAEFPECWHSNPSASWQSNHGDLQGADCLKMSNLLSQNAHKNPTCHIRGRSLFILFLCSPDLGLRWIKVNFRASAPQQTLLDVAEKQHKAFRAEFWHLGMLKTEGIIIQQLSLDQQLLGKRLNEWILLLSKEISPKSSKESSYNIHKVSAQIKPQKKSGDKMMHLRAQPWPTTSKSTNNMMQTEVRTWSVGIKW